ncbi:PH domain-containing protein [Nocardia mikamii]|uniref:PH domain-containing protein n=1 Tax=Nocardia mikamii TaxID=508464 RepID=UPI0007A46BAD|nr:PH domain-containing protein [Nocardia mikamii]
MTRSPEVSPVRTILAAPAWRASRRAPLLWAAGPAIFWAIALVGEVMWAVLDGARRGWALGLMAATVALALFTVVVVPIWRYAVHRWEVTDGAVYTRTGWFTQESRVAPITRVQTVDTHRGPLERMFGLATVTVTTASSAGAVRIAALDLDVAERTVNRLTDIASIHREDAT